MDNERPILLPCPFCGGDAKMSIKRHPQSGPHDGTFGSYMSPASVSIDIGCAPVRPLRSDCPGRRIRMRAETEPEAIKAWNLRSSVSAA